jgi:hypothetical protein
MARVVAETHIISRKCGYAIEPLFGSRGTKKVSGGRIAAIRDKDGVSDGLELHDVDSRGFAAVWLWLETVAGAILLLQQ